MEESDVVFDFESSVFEFEEDNDDDDAVICRLVQYT